MTSRRQFIKWGLVGSGIVIPASLGGFSLTQAFASVSSSQSPLAGANIPQFIDALPTFVGKRVKSPSLTVGMQEFQQQILPASVYSGLSSPYRTGTYVWGYKVGNSPASFPGYTVEAVKGTPTTITYVNNLPLPGSSKLAPSLTIDQTIHWADPLKQMGATTPYNGSIPTVPHLHGAEVSSLFDGGPDQWFTTNGLHGKGYRSFSATTSNAAVFSYPNLQPATTLWFHDHTLGLTRINVFAGLAAFYLLRDQFDTGLPNNPLKLPASAQEIELAIQDRQFDTNGQLLFPDGTPAANPTGLNGTPPNPAIHPYWIPEFFGDVITVNGKAWPYLNIEPRRYRFRILNGSNARFYRMTLTDASSGAAGPAFWQIGTDGGLLDHPVKLNDPKSSSSLQLFLAPGERADIIIDFASLSGHTFTLTNSAVAPYPSGNAPDAATTGRIMQFRVNQALSGTDTTYNPATGASLRGGTNQPPALVRLANPTAGALASGVTPNVKRQLVLVEDEGDGGPIEVLLNNTKWDGVRDGTTTPVSGSHLDNAGLGDYLTERPRVGSTEEWDIINLTQDAHPIHIHLIQFQLINRQAVDVTSYRATYDALFPGGTYAGVTASGTWGTTKYAAGTYIPGYGSPLSYTTPNAIGALGGNPDVTPNLTGSVILPDANEVGWKDTLKVYPGQVTRLVIRWAPTATAINAVAAGQNLFGFDPTTGPGYVWHCHIIDHEDNEMMRPYMPIL